ncbi:exported hypothetical protein [Candidatus Sulfopaludibacter sp. SbA6]|nr:exported hypothetical protein [Candidatus Sulfopaludibacter sp. SbA6]
MNPQRRVLNLAILLLWSGLAVLAQVTDLNVEKTRQEIEKLREEVASLRDSNARASQWIRTGSTVVGAFGGLLTALAGVVFAYFVQNRYTLTQNRKLEQDSQFQRESHNLDLFKGLADPNPRLQFAAASVSLQRLQTYGLDQVGLARNAALRFERAAIVQVLISVLKEKRKRTVPDPLNKFIADNLVRALGAIVPDGEEPPNRTSELSNWDFQNTHLVNCYWRRVDARGTDFFRADISNAGLRGAFFTGAVLREASLANSILRGADLTGADLTGANVQGAVYDSSTRWPAGFDAVGAGAIQA